VREEQARGTTVFLTTHDMMEADKLANRVAFINHGRIVALDTPHALKQQYGKRSLKAEVVGAMGGWRRARWSWTSRRRRHASPSCLPASRCHRA
jgi:ABC-type multidrug transport system ATPase subunit